MNSKPELDSASSSNYGNFSAARDVDDTSNCTEKNGGVAAVSNDYIPVNICKQANDSWEE